MTKPKLLLHTCCAPCLTAVWEQLKASVDYEIALYWFNSNIYPHAEYTKRLEELEKYTQLIQANLIIEHQPYQDWQKEIIGLEQEPEGGLRCGKCMQYRLEKTAQYALQNGFNIFTTTLSISPYKNTTQINQIGQELAIQYGVDFLAENFQKNNNYQKSIQICREHQIYRQKYCGCQYSQR